MDDETTTGLTPDEAARRLSEDGPNELAVHEQRTVLRVIVGVLREPMLLLLLACGAVYMAFGDLRDALMLSSFVVVIVAITVYQEHKTENALAALRDLSSPRALVVRGGQQRRIAGREVVRGDVLLLAEGDRVPADALLLESAHTLVDESLLTGESVPVRKRERGEGDPDQARPGGDATPHLYAATLVVRGHAIARVTATGMHTEVGRIGKGLGEPAAAPTGVQVEVRRLVRVFAWGGAAMSTLLLLVFGLHRGDWLNGLLAGLTLAMAVLPEEFPVVLTVFLALGAWRLSRRNVLTRRTTAVETLGEATVIACDKTGTLTENRMKVARLLSPHAGELDTSDGRALPEEWHGLAEVAVLASQRQAFDPMDAAITAFGAEALAGTEHLHETWVLEREYPLAPNLLALSHVWRSPEAPSARAVVATKGAPEAVADLCHLPEPEREALRRQVSALADRGLRVLGVARAYFEPSAPLPDSHHDFDFELMGLVALADPVRAEVPAAVARCHEAGVRVVMITGDYAGTARSIARAAGIAQDGVVTGAELEAMSEEVLRDRVRSASVFARVLPEQKLRIVKALRAAGEVVAMTGDGVNDAPALRAADIGIAMGARGTDVAREASSLVLTDDHFASVVDAIRTGRGIFDNLKKALAYIVAVHIPIAGLSLLPVLLGGAVVLEPIHIALLQLVIDPVCSVVFEAEPEEPDVMSRPPRRGGQPLVGARGLALSAALGMTVLGVSLGALYFSLSRGASEDAARTIAFVVLMGGNLGLIQVNRSWRESTLLRRGRKRNRALLWVVGAALLVLGVCVYTPGLHHLFYLTPVPAPFFAAALAAGLASPLWFEAYKALTGAGVARRAARP